MPLTLRAATRAVAGPGPGADPGPGTGPSRLKQALLMLNQAEEDRISGESKSSSTSDMYSGLRYSLDAGSSRKNGDKNRYGNILSYDHALLPGPYLNASLIPPPKVVSSPLTAPSGRPPLRSYIASQAPLPTTFLTFLAHICSNRVALLINLAPLTEHGVPKADAYWPASGQTKRDFGDGWSISRSRPDERIGDEVPGEWDVVKRSLVIHAPASVAAASATSATGPTEEERHPRHQLTMLHVCSWADFGTSGKASFERLLSLIEDLNGHDHDSSPPLWLHCSAGVGRSGTVIAGLMARDLARHGSLSAFSAAQEKERIGDSGPEEVAMHTAAKLVDHQRRYRPKMVQTPQQLAMIVDAVSDCLCSPPSTGH